MQEHRHTVLIIDDDTDVLDAIQTSLALADVVAHAVGTGDGALELLRGGLEPCLIFLDVRMPGLDGWEVWEEIRRDPTIAAIPVVLVSGEAPDLDRVRRDGLAGWLQKPVGVEALHTAIVRVCPPIIQGP